MNLHPGINFLFKLLLIAFATSPAAYADTWRNLGKLSNLEPAGFGLIQEACQYRIKSLLSRTSNYLPADGRGLPGVMYMDNVSRQQASVNFGQTILFRSVDYDIVSGLKSAAAFVAPKDGPAAQKIFQDGTLRLLGARIVLTEGFSFFKAGQPTVANISLEIHYISGKRGVRKYFPLSPDEFELETDCLSST